MNPELYEVGRRRKDDEETKSIKVGAMSMRSGKSKKSRRVADKNIDKDETQMAKLLSPRSKSDNSVAPFAGVI